MIVSGFADNVSKELPLEYAVEMNNLIQIGDEGQYWLMERNNDTMNTEQRTHVNPLPAKTWNHLKVNDALLKWETDTMQEQELSADAAWSRASIDVQEKTGCGDGLNFVFDGVQVWKSFGSCRRRSMHGD